MPVENTRALSRIIGKSFSQDGLTLVVKENFYHGQLTDLETLGQEMEKATIVNLTGNKVVDFALKHDFLDEDSILKISHVQHAQIILI